MGRQVNFLGTRSDLEVLVCELRRKGAVLIAEHPSFPGPELHESDLDIDCAGLLFGLLVRRSDLSELHWSEMAKERWSTDKESSPVVEFRGGGVRADLLAPGRLWY